MDVYGNCWIFSSVPRRNVELREIMSRHGGPSPITTCPSCGGKMNPYMPHYDDYGTLVEEVKCPHCGATFGGAGMWKE